MCLFCDVTVPTAAAAGVLREVRVPQGNVRGVLLPETQPLPPPPPPSAHQWWRPHWHWSGSLGTEHSSQQSKGVCVCVCVCVCVFWPYQCVCVCVDSIGRGNNIVKHVFLSSHALFFVCQAFHRSQCKLLSLKHTYNTYNVLITLITYL